MVGGFLVTHFGWRSIFLINIPIGLVGLALILRCSAPNPRNEGRSLDLPGQVAAIIALASLATALTDAAHLGWMHPRIVVALGVAVLATTGFILIEARSRAPMLPLSFFASTAFSVASITGVIVNFAYYGLIFVFSLFFQLEQHLSPQETGLAFLPMTVVLMIMNIIAGRLITRLGARRLMVFGLLLAALGYLLLLPVSVGGSYWQLVVPMLMAASGIALMVPTMTNVTLSSVDPSRAGISSVFSIPRGRWAACSVLQCAAISCETRCPPRSCKACISRSSSRWCCCFSALRSRSFVSAGNFEMTPAIWHPAAIKRLWCRIWRHSVRSAGVAVSKGSERTTRRPKVPTD